MLLSVNFDNKFVDYIIHKVKLFWEKTDDLYIINLITQQLMKMWYQKLGYPKNHIYNLNFMHEVTCFVSNDDK